MTADEAADEAAAPHPSPPVGSLDGEIIRQSLDAIIVTDPTFVVRTWNPAAELIYGIAAPDVVGRRFRDVVETLGPSGKPLDSPAAEAELAASGSWRGRVIHRPRIGTRAGRDVIVDSVVATLRDAAGSTAGALGINRDVTATATLEAEIAALGSLVVATDRARTKAEVAHAALEILIRATGADAGLVTSTDSTYEATAHIGVTRRTIDVILAYGQLGGPLAKALDAPDAYVSADVATAPLREDVRAAVLEDGIRHLVVVGLRLAGQLTGILALGWRRASPVEPSRPIVHQAAALVASSLENARLLAAVEAGLEGERRLTGRMRALVELTELPATTARDDFDTARLLAVVRAVVAADAVIYARVAGDRFEMVSADTPEHEAARRLIERPLDAFPTVAAFRSGATALLFPVGARLTSAEGAAAASARGFRTMAGFALREASELVGCVFVGFRRPIDDVEIDDRTLEAIGRILDISFANRRLREVVSASERRYRDLFESAPEALLVADRNDVVVDANPAAIRLYGQGLIGRAVGDLVAAGEPEVTVGGAAPALPHATGIGRRLDGSTFPEAVDLRTVDIGGEPHVLAIVHDLTDEARIQAELVQAQKMEAIGLLVAGVAHELNNPLASIVAFSQLIRSDPNLPADLRTQADLLVQEANRTRVIVQNLLDFARQRPPERVRTDLRPLVDSVLALQSYVLSRNRLTADVDIPDDLPALLVDRGQIQQVLVNLTFNSAQAIRSAGRPGTIRIEARPVAERAGDGDGDGEVRKVRIAVVDDGPGVPAEILDRLFMPFATTKPPGEGTGLGLSVSFGIVTGHGGTLRHEPNASGGATFVVELPVEPGAGAVRTATRLPSSAGAAAPPDEAAGAPPRILVLDDEPSIREFLARTLVRYGYEPVLAGDGPAALEIVRSDPPAAILCDHRMAGMSGTEFHAAVGAIAPELSRRFAFMSGDVLNPELREFAAARGVHLLAKPFDLSTVQMVVGALLEERD